MPPRIGLPLAALFTAGMALTAGACWTALSRSRRNEARLRIRQPYFRQMLVFGVVSGALAGAGALRYNGNADSGRSFWFYVLFWLLGAAVPLLISVLFLVRWIRINRPEEWEVVRQGALWAELSPTVKRAYFIALVAAVVPASLIALLLFRPVG